MKNNSIEHKIQLCNHFNIGLKENKKDDFYETIDELHELNNEVLKYNTPQDKKFFLNKKMEYYNNMRDYNVPLTSFFQIEAFNCAYEKLLEYKNES